MSDLAPGPGSSTEVPYEPHVGESRQYWRDIILGVNDGLVSIYLLVAGVVGGGLATTQVLLAAVAGAIGGAVSMAAGEFLATQSQEEVFDREIALEREHIKFHREMEVEQLYGMFRDLGIAEEDLDDVVTAFTKDDETLLNAMKVLEFGVVEEDRRSPYKAMWVSGITFIMGSLPPLVPFAFAPSPGSGLLIASGLTAIGLFAVGVVKTRITNTNPLKAGAQNLVIAGVGGIVAFVAGKIVESLI